MGEEGVSTAEEPGQGLVGGENLTLISLLSTLPEGPGAMLARMVV